jgi:hypothetical protein
VIFRVRQNVVEAKRHANVGRANALPAKRMLPEPAEKISTIGELRRKLENRGQEHVKELILEI